MKFSTIIQNKRDEFGFTVKQVAARTLIDTAVVSKIETGKRIATRNQVLAFINLFNLNDEEAFSAWLSDKVLALLKDEEYALKALKVAEDEVKYITKPNNTSYSKSIAQLMSKVDSLKAEWFKCKPLNVTKLRKMREHFDILYTFDSNQIEGNTLTYQETHLVINEGVTIGGKSMRDHLEAINHYEAIDFIYDVVNKNESITEQLFKEIHYLILKGIDRTNAGVYRSVPVLIGDSKHRPPEPFLVAKQMEDVFGFYLENKNKLHPVVLAAEMQEKIVKVHPFIDGNGRTSRLVLNLILLMNGFTIASLKGDIDSRMRYYQALENIQLKNNSDDFYILILETAIKSLEEHIELAG